MTLTELVRQEVEAVKVKVVYIKELSPAYGSAFTTEGKIELGANPRSRMAMIIILHELGHFHHPIHPDTDLDRLVGYISHQIVEDEIRAWVWAYSKLSEAGVRLKKEEAKLIGIALGGYLDLFAQRLSRYYRYEEQEAWTKLEALLGGKS